MTNKIDTFLKAINDRMMGALPSDTVKSPKLNVNPNSSVSSARSCPKEDPQSSSCPVNLANAIKTCFKPTNDFQKRPTTITVFEVAVLEVLAHAPMYNAILDKYVESLELGERITMSIFGVKEIDLGVEDVPYWTTLGKRESYEPRPSTDGIGVRPPYYAKKDFLTYHLPGNGKLLGMPNSTLLRMS
ncbi:hypothetical protein Tco_0425668 [Tanacetum coccineum]